MKKIIGFLALILLGLGLVACDKETPEPPKPTVTDQDIVDAAKTALTLPSSVNPAGVTISFTLNMTGNGGVAIAWASDNSDAIEIVNSNAVVTRPLASAEDAEVKLTATLTKGTASATKEFDLVVLKQEATKDYSDIAEVIAGTVGNLYTIQGVVTGFIFDGNKVKQGYYVTDETGSIYVYGRDSAATLEVGDLVNLTATRAVYALQSINSDQLTYPTINATLTRGNDIEIENIITDATIDSLYLSPMQNLSNHVYEFEVKVIANTGNDGTTGNPYKSFALEGAGGKRVNIYVSGSMTPETADELYPELSAKAGQTVKVIFVINSWSATTYRGIVLKISEIEADPDLDAAKAAVAAVVNPFEFSYDAAAEVTLPQTQGTAALTWESNNEALIAIAAGKATITLPAIGNETVAITVVAEVNGKRATKIINVIVGIIPDAETTSIADVKAGAVGTEYTIEGTVTGFIYGSAKAKLGFYVTDETGSIYVYGTASATLLEVGDFVNLKATRANYAVQSVNTIQLTYPTINNISDKGGVAEFNDVITDKTIDSLTIPPIQEISNNVYEFEAKVIVTATATYKSFALEGAGGKRVNIYVSGSLTPEEADEVYPELVAKANQTIRVLFVINSWNATAYRGIVLKVLESEANPDLEAAQAAIAAVTNPFNAKYPTEGGEVTLPQTQGTAALTWESDNEARIAIAAGKATITLPETGKVVVTITVVADVNGQRATKTFEVEVGAIVAGTITSVANVIAAQVSTTVIYTIEVLIVEIHANAPDGVMIGTDGIDNIVLTVWESSSAVTIPTTDFTKGQVYLLTGTRVAGAGTAGQAPSFKVAAKAESSASITALAPKQVVDMADFTAWIATLTVADLAYQYSFTNITFADVQGTYGLSTTGYAYVTGHSVTGVTRFGIYKDNAVVNTTDAFNFNAYFIGSNNAALQGTSTILRLTFVSNLSTVAK